VLVGDLSIRRLETVSELAEPVGYIIPRVCGRICFRICVVNLHLLDATYELFRAHFGRKDTLVSADGDDIRATIGIIDSTLLLLREPGVTHLAASFDTVIESFRNEMFPAYKSSVGMDEILLRQFPWAEDALEAIGVVVWRNIEFEADDTLAAAAIRWVDDVDQVVICSPDKDLCQAVIGNKIVTYNRRESKIVDEDGVVEKFGIHPESIPDYLALVGDTADGVPGLPGWGAKSASAVLGRFPRLEMIPPSPADWGVAVRGAEKLAATLAAGMDDALLFRELTTLRLDVPIGETLDDLEWKGVPEGRFLEFCARFGVDPESINVHRWA
jgi:5'-3' exonuclease